MHARAVHRLGINGAELMPSAQGIRGGRGRKDLLQVCSVPYAAFHSMGRQVSMPAKLPHARQACACTSSCSTKLALPCMLLHTINVSKRESTILSS